MTVIPQPNSTDSIDLRATICICTRNRPEDLRQALQSIAESSLTPVQVVVADDSDDGATEALAADQPLPITYTRGPRLGLGANRNAAISVASGDYLLFLDDDARLGEDFLRDLGRRLAALPPDRRARTILTGTEIKSGEVVKPNEQGFLGFQSRPYRPAEPLRTVVINATLFPSRLFGDVRFDPQLIYGFDEVDLTTQAVALGFDILPCFEAANFHYPSSVGRDAYGEMASASRLYVTLKRRRWTERSRLRGWFGFAVAAGHVYLAAVKRDGIADGTAAARRTVGQALRYYSAYVPLRKPSTNGAAG